MKLLSTVTLTFTALLTLASALPTAEDPTTTAAANIALTGTGTPTLDARKATTTKPWSATGSCVKGACHYGPANFFSDILPVKCTNSHCDKDGSKCVAAWASTPAETGKFLQYYPDQLAKCPINDLPYEWEWPWVG